MKKDFIQTEAEIFNYECWLQLIDNKQLKSRLEKIILESRFSIVNFVDYEFPIKGYTCVWVLAESHLAIHTFPDSEKFYLQISSCNKDKLNTFKRFIEKSKYFFHCS